MMLCSKGTKLIDEQQGGGREACCCAVQEKIVGVWQKKQKQGAEIIVTARQRACVCG
jgi:hypothetical protein